ncbi:MAG: nuclear transport factor 2 family protein [Acidobacteria bacterium]|nr:nuclear transport factor 2 family protein [Acidobacteriota bacterium]
MNEKHIATRIIICATFALFFLAVTVTNVRSYPPFLSKAKSLGLPATDCTYCHVNASGGEPYDARGKWLIEEKKKRGASAVDVAWLKEYQPDAGGTGSTTSGGSAAPANRKGQGSSAEHEVMRINREWVDAIVRGDASATERFVATDGVFTDATGSIFDRTQQIAMIKSGDLKLESATFDDVKVREYGDTAVVTYRSTDKGQYKGKDFSGQYRWTETWIKRDGKWQQVA